MKIVFKILLVLVVGACVVKSGFAQDPVKLKPDTYKVILNNDKVRVLDIRLKAGDKSPMHSHPDLVLYALRGVRPNSQTKRAKSRKAL